MKEAQLETPKVQVLSFKYIGNYNMILQMQTQVNNQVKTMSSHINTKCENDAYHQNSGLGQHQHDALKLLPTSGFPARPQPAAQSRAGPEPRRQPRVAYGSGFGFGKPFSWLRAQAWGLGADDHGSGLKP